MCVCMSIFNYISPQLSDFIQKHFGSNSTFHQFSALKSAAEPFLMESWFFQTHRAVFSSLITKLQSSIIPSALPHLDLLPEVGL